MATVNLKSLVGRLDETCRRTLEAAAGLCLSNTHYNVEIEHWLLRLAETSGTDIDAILSHYEIDASRMVADLTRSIERFKTGNSRPPALAPGVVDLAKEAWIVASLEFEAGATRSGHILCALLADDGLARLAREASPEFEKIPSEALRHELLGITSNSTESDVPLAGETAVGTDVLVQ